MDEKLIEVEHLKQYFSMGGFLKKKKYLKAVDDVSFCIKRGETFGLVGESGCGKTTIGYSILRLYEPTDGKIIYDGKVIFDKQKKIAANMLEYRRKMQIVFQDPHASLNPRMPVSDIVGGQAEKWKVSDDGLTWTFYLRDGLKWSDGSELTAKDFEYSWKRMCDPEVAAPYGQTVLGMVKGFDEATAGNVDALGVTAKDDKTLVVELNQICTYFGSLASFISLCPVQKETIEKNGDKWATEAETLVSNGPYYFTEIVPDSHITMSKNPNYWNADAVKLDKLTFALLDDPNTAFAAYEAGEIEMVKSIPTEEVGNLQERDDFYREPLIGTYFVNLNVSRAPFDNEKVRQALSLAVDRKYVANTLFEGTYTPASSMIGPGWKDADGKDFKENANGGKPYIDVEDHKGNLEKAKALLAEAGYPNGEGFPEIGYATTASGYNKVLAEYLQQAWAELGINLRLDIIESPSLMAAVDEGNYDTSRNGWVGDYPDPSNMLEIFYSTNGNNQGRYVNSNYDAAIDVARTTTDLNKRSEALHNAEDILMNEAACIPVAYFNDFWLQTDKVKDVWHSACGFWHFENADIAE